MTVEFAAARPIFSHAYRQADIEGIDEPAKLKRLHFEPH
jgi:hypothetical protein